MQITYALKNNNNNITSGKSYRKPEITRVVLDNSISLVMMTTMPPNPPPRPGPGGPKGDDGTFESPFDGSPFN